MKYLLIVFLGGGIGACTRYLFAQFCSHLHLPIATFFVNILGCFLIGLSLPYFFAKSSLPEYRLFLVTGFLGSLTTFSTLLMKVSNFLPIPLCCLRLRTSCVICSGAYWPRFWAFIYRVF